MRAAISDTNFSVWVLSSITTASRFSMNRLSMFPRDKPDAVETNCFDCSTASASRPSFEVPSATTAFSGSSSSTSSSCSSSSSSCSNTMAISSTWPPSCERTICVLLAATSSSSVFKIPSTTSAADTIVSWLASSRYLCISTNKLSRTAAFWSSVGRYESSSRLPNPVYMTCAFGLVFLAGFSGAIACGSSFSTRLPMSLRVKWPATELGSDSSCCSDRLDPSWITLLAIASDLGARDVDVLEQDVHSGFWWSIGLGLGNLLVNVLSGSLVVGLDLVLGGNALLYQGGLQAGNWIVSGSHVLDLLSGSVGGTWVGHRVTSVSVGLVLNHQWALALGTPVLGELGGLVAGQDVHTVDLQTGNVLAPLVVLDHGGRSGGCGTHTVLVVLTGKDTWQVPQLGHVERLEHLALVGGSVTVQGECGIGLPSVLVCKGQSGAQWHLGTHNTVSSVEAWSKHVHRATFSVRNTGSSAHQLTQNLLDGSASHVGEAVASVRCDHGVLGSDSMLDTHSNCLLTHRQVAETSDLLGLVQGVGGHLHSSDHNHVLVHLEQGLLLGLEGQLGNLQVVALERRLRQVNGDNVAAAGSHSASGGRSETSGGGTGGWTE